MASSLCNELYNAGHVIDSVVSEKGMSARNLAKMCNAEWSAELLFPESTQIIIVSVPDRNLSDVLQDLRFSQGTLVAHTAGSFGLEVFPAAMELRGVFYPLQTFSIGRKIDYKNLPVLIETDDKRSEKVLSDIALSTGAAVNYIDAAHRRKLHVAAVFVSNFVNYMLTTGKNIAEQEDFSLDILIPLIRETFAKALEQGPENSQTGPASRNDRVTIDRHLELLRESPELQGLYRSITDSIINYYKHKRG